MKALVATVIAIGMLALGTRAVVAQSGNDLFQQALVKERTEGNPTAAIALYQTIVDKHRNDRALVARALVQMGQCYEKLGRSDAVKAYERVGREFGDQKESAATARARLAALQSPAVAQAVPTTRRVWDNVEQWSYRVRAPSADGRYVSFSGEWDDLYVRDLWEGTTRRLTTLSERTDTKESVAESLVSPDGRYVAYGWDGGPTFDFRMLPVSGPPAEPRILHRSDETDYVHPVGWTPDGKSLLVLRTLQDRTGQIAFLSIADGSLRVVKSPSGWDQLGEGVSLSPDGRFIAYDAPAGPGEPAHDIFVLAADGSRETVVARSRAEDREPVWSPDGSQILFRSNRTGTLSLWTVHIDAGTPKGPPELVRTDVGRLLGMTRSGALYHVTAGPTSNIYSVEVDANMTVIGAPVLATDRFVDGTSHPRWSRDGQSLAYLKGSAVVIRAAKTGDERRVLTELSATQLAGWFPDGRSLLATSVDRDDKGQLRTGFHRLDTTSGRAEALLSVKNGPVDRSPRPDLSPDGKSIFYVDLSQEEPGTPRPAARLMRFDIDGRRTIELIRGTVPVSGSAITSLVAVSPDGTQVAYFEGGWLSVMPVAGGEPRKVSVSRTHEPRGLTWTHDQRYLLVRAQSQLWRAPVAGGELEMTGLSGNVNPTLDPDRRRITYQRLEDRPWELWALENFLPKPRASK